MLIADYAVWQFTLDINDVIINKIAPAHEITVLFVIR